MMKEAEAHAEEDRKRKELVEAKNEADQLVYTVEKTIKDLGDKVDQAEIDKANEAKENVRKRWRRKILSNQARRRIV